MVKHGQTFWDLMLQSLNDKNFWTGNSNKPSQAWLESFTPGRQGCRESSALKVTRPGSAPDARVTSDISCPMSDVRRLMFVVWYLMWDISCLICVLWCLMSHVWCLLFDVRCLMSGIWCQTSDIRRLMPYVKRHMSDVCCLMSDVLSDIWLFVV